MQTICRLKWSECHMSAFYSQITNQNQIFIWCPELQSSYLVMAAFTVIMLGICVAVAVYSTQAAVELPTMLSQMKKSDAFKYSIDESYSFNPTRVTRLSWRPRTFLCMNFLRDEECAHLIELARDKLEKSMVADNVSGKSIMSEIRTSSGMFLNKSQDEIVARIEDRIAAWTFLPKENGEAIQILHYENGQKYEPHVDFFHDEFNKEVGGHRTATVLMYLSDVIKGGETVFPYSEESDGQLKDSSWSECAKGGYSVKPRKGDAQLFFSLLPNGTADEYSLHGSCPVIEGEKWSATKWIHVRAYDSIKMSTSDECVDENDDCAKWAAAGECMKNPTYMIGTPHSAGWCVKSCQAC